MNPEVGFGILPGLILPCMFRGGWKKNTISKKKNYFALNYLRAILLGVPALRLLFSLTSHTEAQTNCNNFAPR